MVDNPEPSPPGLAGHLKSALIGAHEHLAGAINEAKMAHTANVLDTFEADIAPLLKPIVADALDNPAFPEHYRALMEQIGAPEHFSSSLLIGVAVGAIIGPVLGSAVEPYVQNISNTAWSVNPSRPLSPDLLAAAVLKAVVTESAAAPMAAESGISGAHFATMVQTAGQSIGLAESLLLWRRGQITDAELDAILAYSNLNPRFYDDAKALKYVPPSSGEVITGALKGHLTDADATARLDVAGVDPANYDWLKATAGRPPGTMEMLDLWNKSTAGLITTTVDSAVVERSVKQSDINDDYWPYIQELRHYFPPPRSVVPMLRSGAINDTQAGQLLDGYGVGEPWKSAFIAEGHKTSTGAVKTLTQSQIVASYETRLMDRPTALARLEAVKYDAADANALLDLADEKHALAMQTATVNMVGRRYVAYKLAKTDATHYLSAATVPNAAQLDLFKLWDIERQANVHVLTPASIVGAFRRGEITAADCKTRLLQGGVAQADLAIMVADGWPPGKPGAAQAAALAVVNA